MRHIPVIGKFLVILCAFGLFVAGVTAYSSSRISFIDTSYTALLEKESNATLMLARASRSLVSIRSAIADILIARDDADKKAAVADMKMSEGFFTTQIDAAMASAPDNARIAAIKAEAVDALKNKCGPLIAAASIALAETEVDRTQADFASTCRPSFTIAINDITDEIGKITALTETRHAGLVDMTRDTIITTIVSVVAGLAVMLVAGFFAVRAWIARPLDMLSGTMTTLANGNLDVASPKPSAATKSAAWPAPSRYSRTMACAPARSKPLHRPSGLPSRPNASAIRISNGCAPTPWPRRPVALPKG